MSDQAKPLKILALFASLKLLSNWLWAAAGLSFLVFCGFLYFLSLQTPDQYAMTQHPPWQHGMNHNELIAYHRALKTGLYQGEELGAKQFLYRQGSANQLYAQQAYSNTYGPQTLPQTRPERSLTIEDITGFASRSTPVNQYSLQQAQQSVALERDRAGVMNVSEVAATLPAGIYVQTASLRSVDDAAALRRQLESKGFSPFIQEAIVRNQRWYRVRFGPFQSQADATQAAQQLRANRHDAQIIHTK